MGYFLFVSRITTANVYLSFELLHFQKLLSCGRERRQLKSVLYHIQGIVIASKIALISWHGPPLSELSPNSRVPLSSVASERHLRSESTLCVPRHPLNAYSRRLFFVAGPTAWNTLPDPIRNRNATKAVLDDCFKSICLSFSALRSSIDWCATYILTWTYLRMTPLAYFISVKNMKVYRLQNNTSAAV